MPNTSAMKNYDLKHISYHILAVLYFIWLPVFCILLSMALSSILGNDDPGYAKIYIIWISLNLIMGTSVFFVLQLFGNRSLLARVIFFSYIAAVATSVFTIFFIMNRV